MLKCPFCHFDNEDGALFCEQCKSDLASAAPIVQAEALPLEAIPTAAPVVMEAIAEPLPAAPYEAIPVAAAEAIPLSGEPMTAEPIQAIPIGEEKTPAHQPTPVAETHPFRPPAAPAPAQTPVAAAPAATPAATPPAALPAGAASRACSSFAVRSAMSSTPFMRGLISSAEPMKSPWTSTWKIRSRPIASGAHGNTPASASRTTSCPSKTSTAPTAPTSTGRASTPVRNGPCPPMTSSRSATSS